MQPRKKQKRGKGNGCQHYKQCGGCQLQNMTYEEQLGYKQAKEIRLLGRFCYVSEIIGMETPYHYRCKVQAAFGVRSGRVISGIYQSSTHRIVSVSDCMIEDEIADSIIGTIRRLTEQFGLGVFNEKTMKGFLRHVLIRRGYYTGEVMVVMVTGTPVFPKKKDFLAALLGAHPEITTVVQSVNRKFTALVLGDTFETLYGNGFIRDSICGKTFRISPASFYQVNPVQTQVLYQTAIDALGLTGTETVVDAYCGTGTIGMLAAEKAGRVVGVEQNAAAVRDAKINAKENGVENIAFYRGDAGEWMRRCAEAGETADAVIMDPPRAGSTPEFIRSVVTLNPKKVVYVSCDPETLARDLALFVRNGYAVKMIQPVDMFPHTSHIESVALLVRKDSVI